MTGRRAAIAPAIVLFAIMTAHTILETARDALFLAKIGPQHLAWAYLTMAAVASIAIVGFRRWGGLRDPRRLLISFLITAVLGTTILATTVTLSSSVSFILYVWTGVVATLVVPTFWTMIDRALRISEAKKLFAVIGAGGALGALTGSALAGSLASIMPAHSLVAVGAAAFLAAVIAAIALSPRTPMVELPRREHAREVPDRYARWMFAIVLVSTITLTIGDLTFKRVIAERLEPDELAVTFGAIYTGLNVLSLTLQVAITPLLLTRFGVGAALLILPVIVATSSFGFAATGALVTMVALKLGDGALRHSLHRVATEILYLPMPAAAREALKPITDAFGQRGGQAMAALGVLGLSLVGATTTDFALVTAALAIAWLVVIVLVRSRYVQQFRNTLREGEIQRDSRLPELDVTSTELLLASLSSPDEVEALAALELLARMDGGIPALVLYHPQRSVVRRALQLLGPQLRPEHEQVLIHLLEHPDPEVRAAAVVAAHRTDCHNARVREALADPDREVRAVALLVSPDAPHAIASLLAGDTADRLAVARALALTPEHATRAAIADLLARREPRVLREVLGLLARMPELAEVERLQPMLADPHVRSEVRRVYLAVGESGLCRLIEALDDPRTPVAVRRHIPRTLALFGDRRAAAALVARLPREPDGTTEFKILRALGGMRARSPRLPIDAQVIRTYAQRAVADAARYATLYDQSLVETHRSPELELLAELLAEKRRHAIEHVFRALHVLRPRAGWRSVHDAITSGDPERRAAAREIVEQDVRAEIRGPLLAVLDELPPEARRARLGSLAAGPFPTHEAFISELLADRSESMRCIVAHHVSERRLLALRPDLARLRALGGPPLVTHAYEQAIARLDA